MVCASLLRRDLLKQFLTLIMSLQRIRNHRTVFESILL